MGNRGVYKDGWYATTLHKAPWEAQPRSPSLEQDKWELYNTAEDFSCAKDIAAQNPDKLKEMQAAFITEAVKYNVLPLDDRIYERFNPAVAGRPDLMAGRASLTVYEGMTGMKENAFINTKNTSHSITADVEVPQNGVSGVILAQGSLHAGWSFYVKDSKPKFAYNFLGAVTTLSSAERLPAGRVTVAYDFVFDGGKPGAGGTGTILINGKKVATGRIERTIPFFFGAETADVGMDLYTPVTSDYAKGKNQFTGKIDKVTIELKKTNAAAEAAKKDAEEKEGESRTLSTKTEPFCLHRWRSFEEPEPMSASPLANVQYPLLISGLLLHLSQATVVRRAGLSIMLVGEKYSLGQIVAVLSAGRHHSQCHRRWNVLLVWQHMV